MHLSTKLVQSPSRFLWIDELILMHTTTAGLALAR